MAVDLCGTLDHDFHRHAHREGVVPIQDPECRDAGLIAQDEPATGEREAQAMSLRINGERRSHGR
jgi:predicted ATPase